MDYKKRHVEAQGEKLRLSDAEGASVHGIPKSFEAGAEVDSLDIHDTPGDACSKASALPPAVLGE